MLRRVPTNAIAGVGLSVSVRPNSGGRLIALDFVSVGGRKDGHDLTPDQVDVLIESLLVTRAEATAESERLRVEQATPGSLSASGVPSLDKSSGGKIAS